MIMQLQQASNLARRVMEILAPHCERIDIAGSIRRQKPEVKDIEVVAIPKKIFVQTDLFGAGYHTPVAGFVHALEQFTAEVIKGQPDGRYMQIRLKGGATLDLFLPDEADYFRQLAIRTGSSKYSNYVLAHAWRQLGWCGSDLGLRRQVDCEAVVRGDKTSWRCINPDGAKPPVWPSEEAFFEWLNLKWIAPQFREIPDRHLAQ